VRHLYLQIYVTVVGVLLLFGVLASVAWWLRADSPDEAHIYKELAALAAEVLPSPDAAPDELQNELERLATRFSCDAALFSADGEPLAAHGEELPPPAPERTQSGWLRLRGGAAIALRLPDGRWLVARHHMRGGRNMHFGWLFALLLLGVAVGVGSYPVVRRLTGRLERLQSRVDELGAGDLAARVQVEGRDEIAELARSFNRAAERIEQLVDAQKSTLVGASHELRSPLARMRMAIELLGDDTRPELRERIARDIAELDDLIEELLLASRLDAVDELGNTETVDLLALLAEEGARNEAEVQGEPLKVRGDARMLRRLVRNLIENAVRYGAGSPIEIFLDRDGERARIRVEDRGPGVAEGEREKIFQPFYRPPGSRESADGGFGLGLSLVAQIAQHHGGQALCLPRDGGGTCFEVVLAGVQPDA
jgi:signal transduction histidine kinase